MQGEPNHHETWECFHIPGKAHAKVLVPDIALSGTSQHMQCLQDLAVTSQHSFSVMEMRTQCPLPLQSAASYKAAGSKMLPCYGWGGYALNTCLLVVQLLSGYVRRNLAVGAGIQKPFDERLLLSGPSQLEQAMCCCLDSIASRSQVRKLGHHQGGW